MAKQEQIKKSDQGVKRPPVTPQDLRSPSGKPMKF